MKLCGFIDFEKYLDKTGDTGHKMKDFGPSLKIKK